MSEPEIVDRVQRHAREWSVVVGDSFETASSVIAFGVCDVVLAGKPYKQQPVVLKVIKQAGDEWRSGEILKAFEGNGVAQVPNWAPGAVLMERLRPGNSLVELALNGHDDEAIDILIDVIGRMSARASSMSRLELPQTCATVQGWAKGFERHIAGGDEQVPKALVEAGQATYLDLCASQREPQLLHGDLQHYNVVFDSHRGWLAIDPKGVIGELEYELGAVLRNPFAQPELFLSPSIIERRLRRFTKALNLDAERTLRWAFAQAILSAIWDIEDGFVVDATCPALRLAEAIRPMLRN